jgi:hypothetical protein
MKSIVRRDTGEGWNEYLCRLMQEELGVDDPSDEDIRRFDKGRTGKKVSNEEWTSATDPDLRIAKMKDGRTHVAYKDNRRRTRGDRGKRVQRLRCELVERSFAHVCGNGGSRRTSL